MKLKELIEKLQNLNENEIFNIGFIDSQYGPTFENIVSIDIDKYDNAIYICSCEDIFNHYI